MKVSKIGILAIKGQIRSKPAIVPYASVGPEFRGIHIKGAPNNSNETYTFMCLGSVDRSGSAKTALKFKSEI